MAQIDEITNASPDNRAYVLSSTEELSDNLLGLTNYLCTLGLEPEPEKPPVPKTTPGKAHPSTTTTTQPPRLEPNPTKHLSSPPTSTTPTPPTPAVDVSFIIEGSDSVGESNFNKSLHFLEEVISQLSEKELIRVTVIQYSVTVTVEISQWRLWQQRTRLLERLRAIRWRGGSKTNTGAAVVTTFQEVATKPSLVPTPPQLVFLVTENPPTDTVTRPPSTHTQTSVYPIGVGPKVREFDLFPLSSPKPPLMVDDYNHLDRLVHRVVNITHNTIRPRFPTLPPLVVPTPASLPSSGTKEIHSSGP